ncbi:MAG: cobalamin B12-binding domain-containing protein, partial [Armatimonadetes bacterium]|nr:cobalamin B12-binding domain-containing protein [Armatimonadota bacterium]
GNCVHVAGVLSFLNLARSVGFETIFLGPATSVADFADAIEEHKPELVAISYRLTPQVAKTLISELQQLLSERNLLDRRFVFGGTPPVAQVAEKSRLFERVFTGEDGPDEVLAFLRGESREGGQKSWGDTLLERVASRQPYPLLRHHYGQPQVATTVAGARQIAEAEVLDVLSVGPDQNAQESFFRREEMKLEQSGAGGVAVRSADDLEAIYEATRIGNYPLVRIYGGTRDLIKWAELAVETINNAWGAIPLCWYNTLDGRSDRPPRQSIAENQQAMAWYAQRGIPVECNEAHHWSMRDAHDTIAVVAAYLGAYNCKAVGVRTYVAQYMFNSPADTSPAMDLAKMLAKIELIESLHDDDFTSLRQTRAGLLSFAADMDMAKGQLAASTVVQLAIEPAIIHVVGYSEGDHAATASEVIESCRIVHGVIRNCRTGMPSILSDPAVQERKEELVSDANLLLEAIGSLGDGQSDPLTDPEVIARAIQTGLLDAPHLQGNPSAAGKLTTAPVDGAIRALDLESGEVLSEQERIDRLL